MIDKIILWSLKNRLLVIITASAFLFFGSIIASRMTVDVFPDLTAPLVTVMTEAHGMAPEEVEAMVTLPIESSLIGAANVRSVRSSSAIGLSMVNVEFDWNTDIYRARQLVSEKLQLVLPNLPPNVDPPVMGPISSRLGEIMEFSLTSKETSLLEVRTIADWIVRPRLLTVPGVSQVINIGGGVKQYHVIIDPYKLKAMNVTLNEVEESLKGSSTNSSGGFFNRSSEEYLIRGIGRAYGIEDIERTVITVRKGIPVLVRDVARVAVLSQVSRGDSSINGEKAVLGTIQKQPEADTLLTTALVEKEFNELKRSLPADVQVNTKVFRLADFISRAIDNVKYAVIEGGILVTIVIFIFLLNIRTTFISVISIPLSLILAALTMKSLGYTLNTMTLGGLAIAIGMVVDDAIVDVENVFRRLRENWKLGTPRPYISVIYDASREIRGSIVFATLIIIMVFLPLFSLSGIEGRMFKPLSTAVIVSMAASLFVALTVTPALCSFFLKKPVVGKGENIIVSNLKSIYRKILVRLLNRPVIVLSLTLILFASSIVLIPFMGREFLPPFDEGTLTVFAITPPGTSLKESDRIGSIVEKRLLGMPDVKKTARRTGRAEMDEHAAGSNNSEINIARGNKPLADAIKDVREHLKAIPGIIVSVGQPIAHRLEYMISGAMADVAIKIFGTDLKVLREKALEIEGVMKEVKGTADLYVEQQAEIPQVRINFRKSDSARYGLKAENITSVVETAYNGRVVSQILEEQKTFDVLLKFEDSSKADINAVSNTLIDTPSGTKVPLGNVADIRIDTGPDKINRENNMRRISVQCNVEGRDLAGFINEAREKISSSVKLPQGYFIVYGGEFENQERAMKQLAILSIVAVFAILIFLYIEFSSWAQAGIVLFNIPMAMIGGVFSVFLTGGTLSVASLIGFITLFGIVIRNGILLISHYNRLRSEGKDWDEVVMTGAMERLNPILMTAISAGLGMLPLAVGGGSGKEIQQPMAIVILGGLITSTFMTLIVIPVVYKWYIKRTGKIQQQ